MKHTGALATAAIVCIAQFPTIASAGYALHEAPTDRLSMLVKAVIEVESPVHKAEVTKRLMESFGVSRAGNRIVESVGIAIGHGHCVGIFHHSGGFVYADKSRIAKVRNRGAFEATERKIEWVSREELDAALMDVVRTGFSISQEAAVSGALEGLGFGRVTAKIATTVNARVASLLKDSD
jgi:hypothetical protein